MTQPEEKAIPQLSEYTEADDYWTENSSVPFIFSRESVQKSALSIRKTPCWDNSSYRAARARADATNFPKSQHGAFSMDQFFDFGTHNHTQIKIFADLFTTLLSQISPSGLFNMADSPQLRDLLQSRNSPFHETPIFSESTISPNAMMRRGKNLLFIHAERKYPTLAINSCTLDIEDGPSSSQIHSSELDSPEELSSVSEITPDWILCPSAPRYNPFIQADPDHQGFSQQSANPFIPLSPSVRVVLEEDWGGIETSNTGAMDVDE